VKASNALRIFPPLFPENPTNTNRQRAIRPAALLKEDSCLPAGRSRNDGMEADIFLVFEICNFYGLFLLISLKLGNILTLVFTFFKNICYNYQTIYLQAFYQFNT